MPRLAPPERREFLAIRALCHAGLSSSELRARVASRLRQHLRADAYCAAELEPTTFLPIHLVSDPWPASAFPLVLEHALLVSPAADPPRLVLSGKRVAVVDELIGASADGDPYLEHHLLPFGYRHEVQVACARRSVGRAFLTFSRTARRGSFASRHLRLLDALAPHLACGIEASVVRQRLSAPTTNEVGVVVLNVDGVVELADHVGQRWLAGTHSAENDPVAVFRLIARLVAANTSGDSPAPPPVLDVGEPVSGAAYTLRGERTLGADGDPRTVVLIAPTRFDNRAELLTQLGLSPRQAQITAALLRGHRVVDVARQLGLSRHTVEHHLKAVHERLGVTSRRQLAARLLVS